MKDREWTSSSGPRRTYRPHFRQRSVSLMVVVLFSTLYSLLSTYAVAAQDESAPPPVRVVSKEERAKLNELTDAKARTKLAVEMMNGHLIFAEQMTTKEDFDSVFRELGCFHGLLDNMLEYLEARNRSGAKVLDNFKRLEIVLRSFLFRIEAIRREVPPKYEDYILTLLKNVRDARSRAVEPFFDKPKSGIPSSI